MNISDYLERIDKVIEEGPYFDTWESLATHPIADWYRKARLGFFIHWGVYSVPAYFNEWYPRLMYYKGNPVYWHHKKKWGKDFDYHQFIPMFTAKNFDADIWTDLFKGCGAEFVMPVAEHHDGFKMYNSSLSEWTSMNMGPMRDVLAEIKEASERKGMKFSVSSHRAENYWFLNGGHTLGRDNATLKEEYRDLYGPCKYVKSSNDMLSFSRLGKGLVPSKEWLENWLVSSCEIVDKYKPSTFYFDFWTSDESFRPYMRKFLAYFYNVSHREGRDVVSFYKEDAALFPCGVYVKERGQIAGISVDPWQCETSTAYNAWCYCTTNRFKKAKEIICNMIDVWSKNGCMVLNVGPKSDSTLCEEELAILDILSKWIKKNKSAIWGTRVFKVHGEGKKQKVGNFREKYDYKKIDYRFLYKLGHIYAFSLAPKNQKKFRIYTISKNSATNAVIRNVSIVGESVSLKFESTKNYLDIYLEKAIDSDLPLCFDIEVG